MGSDNDQNTAGDMTTVFLSGSRSISRLTDPIKQRLRTICEKELHVIVGDANGADKAMQMFLAENQYPSVEVYYAGEDCRNNIGGWTERKVAVDGKSRGRALHTQKDKEMAVVADYGLVLWNGKSAGSIANVFELFETGKKSVIYFAPDKKFVNIVSGDDINLLLKRCDKEALQDFETSPILNSRLTRLGVAAQTSFNL